MFETRQEGFIRGKKCLLQLSAKLPFGSADLGAG